MPKLSEVEEKLTELHARRLADPAKKREHLDPTPMSPPIGYVRAPSMIDRIRDMVRHEMSNAANEKGFESFEEAEDFDVDDEYDPASPWEMLFEPDTPQQMRERLEADLPKYRDPPAGAAGAPKPAGATAGDQDSDPPAGEPKPSKKAGKAEKTPEVD